jgi:hypothetical protein
LTASDYFYGGTAWSDISKKPLTAQTYSNVATNISCTPAPTPAITQITCNPLEVKTALSSCDVESQLGTFCPGVDFTDIKWTQGTGGGIASGCYYITSTDQDINYWGGPASYILNGVTKTNQTNKGDANWGAKVDGGYYLYLPPGLGGQSGGNNHTSSGTPFCKDGVHQLYCSTPVGIEGGVSINASSFLKCRSGDTPASINWTNAPNWNSPSGSTFTNISVSATCGSAVLNATCGNVSIVVPTAVTFVKDQSVNFTANQVYKITFNTGGQNSAFICTGAGVNVGVIAGRWDGEDVVIGANNKLTKDGDDLKPNSLSGPYSFIPNFNMACQSTW